MKVFLITLLFSTSALACKYAIQSCDKRTVAIAGKTLDTLEAKILQYQKIQANFSKPPKNISSCDRVNFPIVHLNSLREDSKTFHKVCENHLLQFKTSVEHLVNPDSSANKRVEGEDKKEKLNKLGEDIKTELKSLY